MTAPLPSAGTPVRDVVVIGAGQAGLSAAHHLQRRGLQPLVLDANASPGGAWSHRWDSLLMNGVHGVSDLPDSGAPESNTDRANVVIPRWFGDYERAQGLEVRRPVRVTAVTDEDGLLRIHSEAGTWLARTLVNATGTWDRPFIPSVPGRGLFAGEQLHTAGYRGAEHFRGRRVAVVGAGASAVQLLGEIAPVTETLWFTRREPVWADDGFDGLEAVRQVEERVVSGELPLSVVSVTGLRLRPQEQEAAALGAYRRHPMFTALEPTGVRMADSSFEPVDVVLWATGFRPAVPHLAPLHLRSRHGGIALLPGEHGPQSATTTAQDPRVQLVGYGPSASTIGANRAGMAAARAVARQLRSTAFDTEAPGTSQAPATPEAAS